MSLFSDLPVGESVLIIYNFIIIIDNVFNYKNNGPCFQIFLGESVLVHCLAGAHRAGTTGIISLMHFQACLFILFQKIKNNNNKIKTKQRASTTGISSLVHFQAGLRDEDDRKWMIEYYHFIRIGLRMNLS